MSKEPEQEQDRKWRRLFRHLRHDLPHRAAPGTLAARVLGELQRRAAMPWWRRSFAHWPPLARTALVATCAGFAGLALVGGKWTAAAVGSLQAHQALALLSVASSLAGLTMRVVSSPWLYSVLVVGAALYAMLIGLGAVAYRTLYLKPLDGR